MSYVPYRLRFRGFRPDVEWTATDGRDYHEPFFEDTLRRLRRLPVNADRVPRRTPADLLDSSGGDAPPAAFIFHVSRCGSTLVSRMLGAVPGCVAISEPPILDDVLRAHHTHSSVSDADRIAWFRGAVAALSRSDRAARRMIVKLDAWHLFELAIVRKAFPRVPFIFVYRNPIEVLVSLMRMPSLSIVRDTVAPAQLGLSPVERNGLGREELAAAVLGAYYAEALRHIDDLVPIAYEELPSAVWRRVLGGHVSGDDVGRLADIATRDAKTPAQPFTGDGDAKRRAATPAISTACARWTQPAYTQWTNTVRRRADALDRSDSPPLQLDERHHSHAL